MATNQLGGNFDYYNNCYIDDSITMRLRMEEEYMRSRGMRNMEPWMHPGMMQGPTPIVVNTEKKSNKLLLLTRRK